MMASSSYRYFYVQADSANRQILAEQIAPTDIGMHQRALKHIMRSVYMIENHYNGYRRFLLGREREICKLPGLAGVGFSG